MSQLSNQKVPSEVLAQYNVVPEKCIISALGNGHINDTFLVKSNNATFVLQKINTHVFPDPYAVVNNAEHINQHLIKQQKQDSYPFACCEQLQTRDNLPYCQHQGKFWRAMYFIDNTYTIESIDKPEIAFQAASAFSKFSQTLSSFDAKLLTPVIPKFHDIEFRLAQLKQAINNNTQNRLNSCQSLIDVCHEQQDFINQVVTTIKELPLRVTHNDTKINNLLFDKVTNTPIAVIDLDTCMPGYLMHDFGDMVRTCCSNLAEDATNIEEMQIKTEILQALAAGYLSSFAATITAQEKLSLKLGARLMPLMIGMRFLTDYLEGDNYFQTHYEMHNLDRAKNQFKLFKLLTEAQTKIDLAFE